MSSHDEVKRIFDGVFGPNGSFSKPKSPDDTATIVETVQGYERRIEKLKAKSRGLIDRAYNRALEDALRVALAAPGGNVTASQAEAVRALRRKVRS